MGKMTFTFSEILDLLNGKNDEWLYAKADKVKKEVYGDEVYLRGIIETSSYCNNNCYYCGIRKDNICKRYRLTAQKIIETAQEIADLNIYSIVLQGGEDNSPENIKLLETVVTEIKKNTPHIDVVLSYGNLPYKTYAKFKDLGASRYLIKMETFQKDFYEKIRPGQKIEDRISCIKSLMDLGYQVGSGFIVGMPGYSTEMLAEDLLSLQKLGVHMFSTTPFISTSDTPWENKPNGSSEVVSRACAIYRILEPTVNIPATTALSVLDPDIFKKSLERGCNVVMCSFTPKEEKIDYKIYKGKGVSSNIPNVERMKELVKDLGLYIKDKEHGRSKKV
jgi:biotin synthase